MHASPKGSTRDVPTTHDPCCGHSALRRRHPGRHACPALSQRRLRHRAELEPRHPAPRREVPNGALRRAGAREVGHIGRLLHTGSGRRHRTRHRRDRYRTPDPRRVVSRRHDRRALRGPAPRAGRWAGTHRRRLPDRHVRQGRRAEGPHAVPPAGVDHRASWQRSAARPGCLPPSPPTS
jgi:hypothetical protein